MIHVLLYVIHVLIYVIYSLVVLAGQAGGGEAGPRGDERWSSSQESLAEWESDEMELEHLQALSRCSTDDDKIRESSQTGSHTMSVHVYTLYSVCRCVHVCR